MERFPAIAIIEFNDIVTGLKATDLMLKSSPVSMLKTGTVSRGHYVTMIGGSVASVEEAYREGLSSSEGRIADMTILPDISEMAYDAILGGTRKMSKDSSGILETSSIASIVKAADSAVKGAEVDIVLMRLGDSLGGRSFIVFTGELHEIQAAIDIGISAIQSTGKISGSTIIPMIDPEFARHIEGGTRFNYNETQTLEGGEF